MLKHRLIACLLWNNGLLVQSRQFRHTNLIGNAYTAVDFFNTWAVDEIILLDVTRTPTERKYFQKQLAELSMRCFIPLSVGGWIRSCDEIRMLLSLGADKVVINTAVAEEPEFLKKAAMKFGSQCIVVSIDVKKNIAENKNRHEVYIDRGRKRTGLDPVIFSKQVEELGAGEIFLTSIDNDGQLKGYDIDLIRRVSEAVAIPVIASGGAGTWQHLVDGITLGKADAVSAANFFHYWDQSTKRAKDYMQRCGVDVRDPKFYTLDLHNEAKYRIREYEKRDLQ